MTVKMKQYMQCIRNYWSTLHAKNKHNIKEIRKGGTIMFGTNITTKRKVPRFKSAAENRLHKKKK